MGVIKEQTAQRTRVLSDIRFTESKFATVDGVVCRLDARIRTIARTLPEGNAKQMAMSAVTDVEELVSALRAGELEPREVPA